MNGQVVTSNDYETLRKWLRGDVIGYLVAGMPRRTGGRAFMTFLEYRHFPPGTPLNGELTLIQVKWEQMLYFVVTIPKGKKDLAETIMTELGLRAANGTPHLICNEGGKVKQAHFPVDTPNLFTIENIEGHFVYHNDPILQKTAYDFEDEACDRVIAEHEAARAQAAEARR